MCGPLRPTPVRAKHEVETNGSRVLIAVSGTDKRRKPHQTPSGQAKPELSWPFWYTSFCALFARWPQYAASLGAHATVTHESRANAVTWRYNSGQFFSPVHFASPHEDGQGSVRFSPLKHHINGTKSKNTLQIDQKRLFACSSPEHTWF